MMPQRVAKDYIGNELTGNTMRKVTDKEEEEIIKEIESDPEIDKKWGPLIKGRVVEIHYASGVEEMRTKKPKTTPSGVGI